MDWGSLIPHDFAIELWLYQTVAVKAQTLINLTVIGDACYVAEVLKYLS